MATRVRLTADVDPDVKKRVKLAAVESDLTLSQWVEEALRERLQQAEPGDGAKPRVSSTAHEELLKAIIADRDGWHLPSPGSKPMGSKNPPRLKDGSKISDAVIEDRR